MNKAEPLNKSSLFIRTVRFFFDHVMESFESPQSRQFRLMKKFISE